MREAWIVRGREMRRLRAEKMLSAADAARKSGISVRRWRELEAGDRPRVYLATLKCVAQAIGCEPADIGRAEHGEEGAREGKKNAVSSAGGTAPSRVRLGDLVDREASQPPPAPLIVDGASVPRLTARAYQACFTAYRVHEGERYVVEGFVEDERGVPPPEAALIDGAQSGVAARFDVRCPLGDGDGGATLAVTLHARDREHVRELQAMNKTRAALRALVRVVVPESSGGSGRGAGLAFFSRERPSPWGLLVERVIEGESRRTGRRGR